MSGKRVAAALAVILFGVLVLGGCQGEKSDVFEPSQSCLYIRDDGTAAGAEISAFTENYYSISELKEYVENLVIEYNRQKAGLAYAYVANLPDDTAKLPVAISRLAESNGNVILILECAGPADYIAINDLALQPGGLKSLTVRTVKEMKDAGQTVSGSLVDTAGAAVSADKAMKRGSYHVVVCEGGTLLQVQGKVKYMSAGVEYVNESTVRTPGNATTYIIYQ